MPLAAEVRGRTKTLPECTSDRRELGAALRSVFRRARTRDVHAVRDLSFQVQPGERIGALEPNGAGKTTTLEDARQSSSFRRR